MTDNTPKWTQGEWFPEKDEPTYNEGANAYQRAIVQHFEDGRVIPGFAFGETAEECTANAWLISASKDLLKAIQKLVNGAPNAEKDACYAMEKALGLFKPVEK